MLADAGAYAARYTFVRLRTNVPRFSLQGLKGHTPIFTDHVNSSGRGGGINEARCMRQFVGLTLLLKAPERTEETKIEE
jgi:hypothetical protein